jgi:hypothetical protein
MSIGFEPQHVAALETVGVNMDINRDWEHTEANIKTARKESLQGLGEY